MSRDQRPGKIRVISGNPPPGHPLRRAGDPGANLAPPAEITEPQPAAKPRTSWLAALLFLIGCAIGGAGFVALVPAF